MIPKGNQRGGGQQLAAHLLNSYDNERVQIAEIRGAAAPDLHGAFKEWLAISKATQCRKYLYSLSINPDHRQRIHTREHYLDFANRAEKALGLAGQPRAIVFHVKQGREHCHVVWSRIDGDRLKAVHIAHDRQKLRMVARAYARDHGLTLPERMRRDGSKDRFNAQARCSNLAERQQQDRTGISKEERRKAVAEAWHQSESGEAFVRALAARGYFLARGDKRAYVIVDSAGEIHSLSRQLSGVVKAKDLKARLASYPLDKIPDAAKAQEHARARREARTQPDMREALRAKAEERRASLKADHARRRAALDAKKQQLQARQQKERTDLETLFTQENTRIAFERVERAPSGLTDFLSRITGINRYVGWRHEREDRKRFALQDAERAALARRHARQRQDFQRHDRALRRVENRERRSLETTLHREEFQAIARMPVRTLIETRQPEATPDRSVLRQTFNEQATRTAHKVPPPDLKDAFNRSAVPPPSQERDNGGDGLRLRDKFRDAAKEKEAQQRTGDDRLHERFNESAAPPAEQERENGSDEVRLRDQFNQASDTTSEERVREDKLREALRQRAARNQQQGRSRDPGRGR